MRSDELLKVMRIRDFLSLILTYPMTLPNQHLLLQWRDRAHSLTAEYSQQSSSIQTSEEVANRCMNLLSEKPLKYLEVLIPNEILSKIEDGQTCIFHENDGSKGKQVVDDDVSSDHLIVPEALRKLAVDLAIDQLIQNLLHCDNIHHVRFFTRNILEKRDAWGKMRESLPFGKLIRKKISAKYLRVLWVDVLKYHSDNAEDSVLQQIAEQLGLLKSDGEETEEEELIEELNAEEEEEQTISYDHDGAEVSIEELVNKRFEEGKIENPNKPYLLFVVDGDGKGNLDPMKLGFFQKRLATVVLMTNTENDELRMSMDLEIRTEDHVLPWQLFSLIVGSFQDDEYLQGIAAKIVDKCRGHLLAIALVARSLKHEKNNDEPWENARKILHESSPDDMLARAFTKIVLDGLNHEEKLCLACSLYMLKMEEKMATHSLVSSWAYYKIVSSQEKAELVLKNLVDRSVLWQIMEGKCIQIQWPAEIYNLLESLLRLQPSYKIKRGGLGLTEPPAMEEWVDAQEMELMDNKLTNLPSSPSSPNLWKLLLQGNADLREIPPSFFSNMPLLEVLNLS